MDWREIERERESGRGRKNILVIIGTLNVNLIVRI